MRILVAATLALVLGTLPVRADFAQITDRSQFMDLVVGKELTRPLVRLQVEPDGAIRGTGALREVRGAWKWQSGLFCRDLYWGERDLGYNCQTVEMSGNTVRFTADQGQGDHADFRVR
ncbi:MULTISPECIES: dihydrodipicolinate reductase [unclassified Rhodosalinus]|uniref:dihydrodipicolinate reductase n=1 Tax=unclassified Rhodosalinus TaxID=2630183 RepID=UPI0035244A0E